MRILLKALYPYFFLLLILLLPFDEYVRALPNILIISLIVCFPLVVEKTQLRKLRSTPIVFLGIFVLYLLLNSSITGRINEDIDVISKVIAAWGLAILYIPVSDSKKIKTAIIFSALAAIVFSVYNFVIIAHETGSFALGDSPQVVESLLIDRIYLGMLCVFSILISVQAITKIYHPLNSYYLGNIIINVVFLLLIASKVSIIALLGLLLLNQFYGKQKIWKYAIVFFAFLGIFGIFYLLKNKENPEVQKTLPTFVTSFVSESMTYEIRATTWECMNDIRKNSSPGFFGFGFEKTEEKLLDCYETNILDEGKRKEFLNNRYNAHNQYLDFYLSAGFLSILLFGIFIVGSLIAVRKNPYAVSMLFLLVFYNFMENIFHRQMGAYYAGIIIIVLMLSATSEEKNELNRNKEIQQPK